MELDLAMVDPSHQGPSFLAPVWRVLVLASSWSLTLRLQPSGVGFLLGAFVVLALSKFFHWTGTAVAFH